MNFNSIEFLIFLPVVVSLYWILPHKVRWILLLAASYFFYMSWNIWLLGLILVTTVTAYVAAIAIGHARSQWEKHAWLFLALVVCLGLLIFFKYIDFILEGVFGAVRLFNAEAEVPVLNLILPVGISFYTFQTLSYVIDVYRGAYVAEKHFGYFALYVAYFPQLVAGPIEKPQTLLPQLKTEQTICESDFRAGVKWLLSGFFRKCVVADFCGIFVDKVYSDLGGADALAVFVASVLFLVQIYNDFAGYSEIAIGGARLMGVKLSLNFDRPLTSVSYTEFFRRWHITLNQWFTQYVYIPLGGNRKGRFRKILNTLVVFSLCGLWHGANLTFVAWGLFAGIVVSLETLLKAPGKRLCGKLGIDPHDEAVRLIRRIVVFVLFSFSCVLFRAQSLSEAGTAFSKIFGAWGFGKEYFGKTLMTLGMTTETILRLFVVLLSMTLVYRYTSDDPAYAEKTRRKSLLLRAKKMDVVGAVTLLYGMFAIAFFWLAFASVGDVSGFQYFQF